MVLKLHEIAARRNTVSCKDERSRHWLNSTKITPVDRGNIYVAPILRRSHGRRALIHRLKSTWWRDTRYFSLSKTRRVTSIPKQTGCLRTFDSTIDTHPRTFSRLGIVTDKAPKSEYDKAYVNLKTSPIFDNFFTINGPIYGYVKCQIHYIFWW